MPKLKIAPSILNSNLGNLVGECQKLMAAGADTLHLDVMDGHFVPNLTFGHPVVESLRKNLGPEPYLDCHLMIENPQKWVQDYAKAGANLMTFHLEAVNGPDEAVDLVQAIGVAGMQAGVAIKPGTKVDLLLEVMRMCKTKDTQVTLALVMTVEPGFGGQKFMSEMLEKVKAIRSEFKECDIQVDGGVGIGNIDQCWAAGANNIVSGSGIIKAADWSEAIQTMKSKCT